MESQRLASSSLARGRLIACASLAAAAFAVGVAPSIASAQSHFGPIRSAASVRKADIPNRGTVGTAAQRAMRQGYLVPNQARYERQKTRAVRHASAKDALTAPVNGALAPVNNRAWAGINDTNSAPPDETSAVGTGRYIELVNSKFAIYNKTANAPISAGSINSMVGAAGTDSVFDVQIMWDATTNRFYYAADDVVSNTNNKIAFGFSKTATPSSAADWCKFAVGFGSTFPDYPKLGDSKFFAIIGSNLFNGNSFVGAHTFAATKPTASDTCSSYLSTAKTANKGLSGGFTPVPASEVDNNATGWSVAVPLATPGNKLQLYKVTKSSTGAPVIGTTPTSVPVSSFAVPPAAPQKGTAFKIDTSDTRNTQAQAAVDPGHGNNFAIWTQHTVKGGAGSSGSVVRDQPGDPLADPARDGDQPVPVRVQRRDRPEPSGQWSHHERREGDVDELQHEFHRDVPVDQDGFQGGRRRAVGSGGRVQRHQAADRVRLHGAGAQPVPVGRLRGGDAGSIDEEPDLEREPVRRRNAVVDVRDVQDLELHRHAIGRTRYGRVARGPVPLRRGGASPRHGRRAPRSFECRPPPAAERGGDSQRCLAQALRAACHRSSSDRGPPTPPS